MKFLQNHKEWFHELLAIIVVLWPICPPILYSSAYRILAVTAAITWVLLTLFKRKVETIAAPMVIIILFTILCTFLRTFEGRYSFIDAFFKQMQIVIFMFYICIGIYYDRWNKFFFTLLLKICFVVYSIFGITTLIAYQTMPGISRLIVRSSEENSTYAQMGIGGYSLVYTMVFMVSIALFMLIFEKKKAYNIFYIVFASEGILLIIQSGYLISNIILLVSLLSFFGRIYIKQKLLFIIIKLLFIGVFLFVVFWMLIQYQNEIIKFFDGTLYEIKAQDIFASLNGNEAEGKVQGRTNLYLESFNSFFRYPLFGAYAEGAGDEVGGHSTLLDIFAWFGISSLGFYIMIKKGFNYILAECKYKGFYLVMVILFFINGIFNTIVAAHGVVLFLAILGVKYWNFDQNYNSLSKFNK